MTNAAGRAIASGVTIQSPCINVCRIERRTGLCEGCRRTADEITRWPLAGDAERAAILADVASRPAARKRLGLRW